MLYKKLLHGPYSTRSAATQLYQAKFSSYESRDTNASHRGVAGQRSNYQAHYVDRPRRRYRIVLAAEMQS